MTAAIKADSFRMAALPLKTRNDAGKIGGLFAGRERKDIRSKPQGDLENPAGKTACTSYKALAFRSSKSWMNA